MRHTARRSGGGCCGHCLPFRDTALNIIVNWVLMKWFEYPSTVTLASKSLDYTQRNAFTRGVRVLYASVYDTTYAFLAVALTFTHTRTVIKSPGPAYI